MDPELKKLLEETYRLAKDNNRMLRAMRRAAWWNFFFKILFWAILIGLPIYLYQTMFKDEIAQFKNNPQGAALNIFGIPSSADIQKLIDSYKSGLK